MRTLTPLILLPCLICLLLPPLHAADEKLPLPAIEALSALQDAFNATSENARVIIVTSDRNRSSRAALRAFRAAILPKITSPDLTVLAIWVPEKSSDKPKRARSEAEKVAEPRIQPYWCGESALLDPWRLSVIAGSTIEPELLPTAGLFAIYPPKTRWEEEIPTPAHWAHLEKKLAKRHPPFTVESFLSALEERVEREPDDVADLPTQTRYPGGNRDQRYFLHGPIRTESVPREGHPLVVVLPGGSGDAQFRSFVKRITKNSLDDTTLVAQLIAKKWTPSQTVVWPTIKNSVTAQEFTTEEYIDAVIADVATVKQIDREKIVLFGYSSSGPALYAHALREKRADVDVTRYFISQSVFHENQLPALTGASGKRIYLHHSREDKICAFSDSERARRKLEAAGAAVSLVEYPGGHGWQGNLYREIKVGVRWLLK